MAYMSDEAYELMQDSKEKAATARSARSTRTHNGKSGCNFSHEKMTKKELESMNGKVETYRMNSPMTWEEFKKMPNDLKVMYVKALRKKYNVPDKYLAEMMGVDRATLCKFINELGLSTGKNSGGKRVWDKEGFLAWCGGAKKDAVAASETPVEEEPEEMTESDDLVAVNDEPEIIIGKRAAQAVLDEDFELPGLNVIKKETESTGETKCLIPNYGEMTFEGNVNDILRTINKTLNGATVHMRIKWDVLDD